MIEELQKNIDAEIGMLREIVNYFRRIYYADEVERRLLGGAITSLLQSIKIINSSVPALLRNITLAQLLPAQAEIPAEKKIVKNLEKIKTKRIDTHLEVVLKSGDKKRFLRELAINEKFIKKLKKREAEKKEKYEEYKGARGYLKLANKLFLESATNLIKKGHFKSLSVSLRKANIDILFESYVAMILFSLFISIIFSILLAVFLLFFDVSFVLPFVSFYAGSYLARMLKIVWIPVALPALIFLATYYYPATEKKSIKNKIDQELPFAVIHMSAIAGSGIEPSEIFKIVGLGKEYPYLRKEVRKVLNQINLYGYDLVTALNNAAKTAPSEKLSELFSGVSVSMTSGASLKDFFEKRAESLLLSYKLERDKYTKLVETFLDIYISLVIAAPMVFLLLIIMMLVSGLYVGFTSFQLGLLSVLIIAVLNVFFLLFLQVSQPGY